MISKLQWLKDRLAECAGDDFSRPWSDYPCILWPFAKDKNGRGKIGNGTGRSALLVYRKAFDLFHGRETPPETKICHHCDVPGCLRVVHLFSGSQADNLRDMRAKGRGVQGEMQHMAKLDDEKVMELRRLQVNGMPFRELSARFEIDEATVWCIVHGKTWKHLPVEPGVKSRSRAKLTEDLVLEIRGKFSDGTTITELAALYGVSDTAIHGVVYRKSWKSVA